MDENAVDDPVRSLLADFQKRLFGLVAVVDRPTCDDERFPLASGVIIGLERAFVLVTAGHFIRDVKRWHTEKRLRSLSLLVNRESGLTASLPFSMEQNPGWIVKENVMDIGFFALLEADLVQGITKHGGVAMRPERVAECTPDLTHYVLIGFAGKYWKWTKETIATSGNAAWQLRRPIGPSVGVATLAFDGPGEKPNTLRFVPTTPSVIDDYSGASGCPIIGATQGATFGEYRLVAVQSAQILGGSPYKPIRLIATPASIAVGLIDAYLEEMTGTT
jgi:hypothetical protein